MEKTNKLNLSPTIKQLIWTFSVLAILMVIFGLTSDKFFTMQNFSNVAKQSVPIVLIAIGQTFVLITGGIDLSIGSNIALSGVVCGLLMKAGISVPVAIVLAVAITAMVGVINGALIVYGKLPPFIVTLGTMTSVRGIALTLTDGIPVSGLPEQFNQIGVGETLGIPNQIYIMVASAIFFGIILAFTKTGRYTYAIGSNYETARLSGVNTSMAIIKVYVFSAILAAIAGLIMAANIISAPPTAGLGYELDAVAASVIGGASTMGGEGTVFGTVIGALIIVFLRNGLNLSGANPFIQQIVIGVVIIGAVYLDRIKKKD